MSMLNQAAVEALCSATYLENYLECMDSLPEEMQRNVTVLRELDSQCNELISEIEQLKASLTPDESSPDPTHRKRILALIRRNLVKCQEFGDEKIQIVSQIIELIENRSRQLHQDLENLDPIGGKEPFIPDVPSVPLKQTKQLPKQPAQPVSQPKHHYLSDTHKQTAHVVQQRQPQPAPAPPPHTAAVITPEPKAGGKRPRRQRQFENTQEEKKEEKEKPKKKKKRKVKKDNSPVDIPIDPDEPTYCLCDQVSYGEMIGCDNEECKIEWFHFNCVNLNQKPKGKWFCPNCRGETSKVPRKDLNK